MHVAAAIVCIETALQQPIEIQVAAACCTTCTNFYLIPVTPRSIVQETCTAANDPKFAYLQIRSRHAIPIGVHSRFHNIVIANEISAWANEGVVNKSDDRSRH